MVEFENLSYYMTESGRKVNVPKGALGSEQSAILKERIDGSEPRYNESTMAFLESLKNAEIPRPAPTPISNPLEQPNSSARPQKSAERYPDNSLPLYLFSADCPSFHHGCDTGFDFGCCCHH